MTVEQVTRLELDLDVDPLARISRGGVVTLTGTVSCTVPANVSVYADVRQRAGRVYITGGGSTEVACDGSATWTLVITSESATGKFTSGNATTRASAYAWDPIGGEGWDEVAGSLRMRPGRK
jgi:hypothetical protein